jgi:serine/threonine-protein kinase RsbW
MVFTREHESRAEMLPPDVTPNGSQAVHLEFTSSVEMLDFVQVVADHLGRSCGIDEDSLHWVSVAIRESVINAIKHGNGHDARKHVFVDIESASGGPEAGLLIRVRDQGPGFDPQTLADPLDPENLLKSGGRGVFLIRNFMDEVHLERVPEGGMEVRMRKRAGPPLDASASS